MRPADLNGVKYACLMVSIVWLVLGCTPAQFVVRSTQPLLAGGVVAMNQEPDLQLARQAMPANLKLLEGMIVEDPGNTRLRLYAAEGFYGYTFGFVELQDSARARQLYRRCYEHARIALQQEGVSLDPETSAPADFEAAVGKAGRDAVPAMFWTASCLANWVNLNRTSPAGIAELASAATLMRRVMDFDDTFYHGGPHLFFGVYYGGAIDNQGNLWTVAMGCTVGL